MCEFVLPEVIKLIFPEWSYGTFLDEHAKGRGITRRAATAAIGKITITGTAGAVIPAGSLFSTASVNGEPSVDFKTNRSGNHPHLWKYHGRYSVYTGRHRRQYGGKHHHPGRKPDKRRDGSHQRERDLRRNRRGKQWSR